jgi:MFS family permease
MYSLDWLNRLKLSRPPRISGRLRDVSPVVWSLGLTSFLTDISSEMVSSILPVYLVLHLHLSPLQFGAIDGVYNGLSAALVTLFAGLLADRWRRHKDVAMFGYGLSAACKLLLLAAGSTWSSIGAIVGLDRLGKGIRSAPRDSLISLYTPSSSFAMAFGVHRSLDAAGALVGPLIAFALLVQIPGQFEALWLMSFIIGALGVAALWLFVPRTVGSPAQPAASAGRPRVVSPRFVRLAVCGTILAMLTVSDGFLYLMLQEKSGVTPGVLPLFYVGTAAVYMACSVPVGVLADRIGRRGIFVGGYVLLTSLYFLVFSSATLGTGALLGCLLLLGLYYAATEGVLMALGSSLTPESRRTTALAVLGMCVGLGKLLSSLGFGWIWQAQGAATALLVFAVGITCALPLAAAVLRSSE